MDKKWIISDLENARRNFRGPNTAFCDYEKIKFLFDQAIAKTEEDDFAAAGQILYDILDEAEVDTMFDRDGFYTRIKPIHSIIDLLSKQKG